MKSTFAKAALVAILSAAALSVAPSSFAGSKTATFQVSLTVQADCSISANPLDFGSTGVIDSNLDQASSLVVTCTKGTPYTVALDAGSAAGSTIADRELANAGGTAQVKYNLYRDVGRTQVWGQTTGTDVVGGTGNGNAQPIPVYGRVPAQSMPAADTYTSTVTATVAF
ncbi:secreted pili protein involved in motility and biofilm formation [Caballeronia arvi]|uniref:Secreted pili protein involved in motility and biofilm formation n=1 Tax=Caballeronia arvi TaxID=1777135 RepID=A0A158FJL0_9BURK|nr:spore coat U domain-containing protein [Caballeronia arvi]SAL20106.1 secreted pili protein involved in motility and biofilm formation [Caballeronia arvi]